MAEGVGDHLGAILKVELVQDIAHVALDCVLAQTEALGKLGRWPWPRSYHAQIIDRLTAAGAKHVAFDVGFETPSEPEDDRISSVEARRILSVTSSTLATNQPDVGRGRQERSVVESMHRIMSETLPIDRIEVCYDADDLSSEFRKPSPGMLLRAAHARQ